MSDLWEVQKPGIVNRTETLEREVAFYAVCSTAGSVAAKTATVDDYFRLEVGSKVCIRFAQTNTASTPTLNVNGTGAYQIRYRDAVGYSGYLKEYVASDRTYEFVFDGEAWQLIGDLDTILAISDSVTTSDSDTAASSAAAKTLYDMITALTNRVAELESEMSKISGDIMLVPTTTSALQYHTGGQGYEDFGWYTPSGGSWFWLAYYNRMILTSEGDGGQGYSNVYYHGGGIDAGDTLIYPQSGFDGDEGITVEWSICVKLSSKNS